MDIVSKLTDKELEILVAIGTTPVEKVFNRVAAVAESHAAKQVLNASRQDQQHTLALVYRLQGQAEQNALWVKLFTKAREELNKRSNSS
jgi:predicted secreted acid phosphatase